jgi:hypothetical protein
MPTARMSDMLLSFLPEKTLQVLEEGLEGLAISDLALSILLPQVPLFNVK